MKAFRHAPQPRYVTPIPEGTPNQGRELGRLARLLGKPFQPWQQLAADGITSLNPDGSYMFHDALITTPRQSGKTTLVGPLMAHRIMIMNRIQVYFTAQTGKDGRERMLDIIKLVTSSPISPLFKPRYAAGSEGLELANGSRMQVFAPGPAALHGTTPALVTLDEIWKHDLQRGTELMGAIGPAQATLGAWAQLIMFSTMGTNNSGFLNKQVERGRDGAPGLFYLEYSMPDGADPYLPQTWWTFHPALGNTIDVGYLEKEASEQPLGEWMRAYMNRLTASNDPLITPEEWAAMEAEPLAVPSKRDIVVSYEVASGGVGGTVMAAWRDVDGVACGRVIHDAPGTAWMVPLIDQLNRVWRPRHLAADDGGETRRLTDALRRMGHDVYTLGPGDFATSCMALLQAAREQQLRHDGTAPLANAIAQAVLQPMGDSLRFSRKHSPGSVAPLIAWAAGLWAFDHQEATLGKPVTSF